SPATGGMKKHKTKESTSPSKRGTISVTRGVIACFHPGICGLAGLLLRRHYGIARA
ncbi:hypothetical protein HMPREF0308_2084, partial [Corynebacterium striatum ATCC 6940]